MKPNVTHGAVRKTIVLSFLSLAVASVAAHGATILPADTQGQSTSVTTGDGQVTLFAYSSVTPLVAGNFNAGGFIGVLGGTNNNAVDDADGNPATEGDREALDIQLSPTVGLSDITFQFTRADGPAATDGIRITGFASDPGAVTGSGTFADIRWDASTNSVYAEITGGQFNNVHSLQFTDLAASTSQTLRLTVADSNEARPQAAISSISYDVVPEPGAVTLLALGGLGLLRRRR